MPCVDLPISAQVKIIAILIYFRAVLKLVFNNIQVGIAIGGLSALAPTRFNVFSGLAFKAMIAGNITNFISGFC